METEMAETRTATRNSQLRLGYLSVWFVTVSVRQGNESHPILSESVVVVEITLNT